jgi:hypothetical protein
MGHTGKPISHMSAANAVCSADGTDQGNAGDGLDGDPLTVAEGDSRVLLGCQARAAPRVAEAKPVFTRLFKAFGLPQRIRTDNGVPLATKTLGRLSHLSAGWVRLGSFPECIEPGTPQQHGRHERRHRPLQPALATTSASRQLTRASGPSISGR